MTQTLEAFVVTCAWHECDNDFVKRTHNQKYCSEECCRYATNDKIMIRYYDDKERKSGKPRFCSCGTKLNRYNYGDQCSSCEAKTRLDDQAFIRSYVGLT